MWDWGGIGGRRRRGWPRMRWLDGITDSMDTTLEWTPGVGDGQGSLACCDLWGCRVGHDWATELNCTEWGLGRGTGMGVLCSQEIRSWEAFLTIYLVCFFIFKGRRLLCLVNKIPQRSGSVPHCPQGTFWQALLTFCSSVKKSDGFPDGLMV